ncbi:putative amino terminal protease [Bradyrhizobiaceae bacterium SG-6C]|nr:putative amino terminal protease [Bradyrhizobiaceae bacterium SG-6C]
MTDAKAAASLIETGHEPPGRIAWLERPDDDFPFYAGKPVEITGRQWWIVMLGVAIGFAALILPPPFLRGPVTQIIPVILFFAIPLAALAWVAPSGWKAIFRRIRGMDVVLMFLFAAVNVIVTMAIGSVVMRLIDTAANSAVAGLAALTMQDRLLFFARAVPQLFGEELLSILPFLALLYWLVSKRGLSRNSAIILCWLLTGVLFAAVHLPTYGWNIVQALAGVGVARLVLTVPYIVTKNIWVCTGAHILNDWAFFGIALLGAGPARV